MNVQLSLGTLLNEFISSVLLGLEAVALFSALALYRWIHGDYDRYLWILHGPSPYSSFESGPFQAAMGVGLLFLSAMLFTAGGSLKWLMWRRFDAEAML